MYEGQEIDNDSFLITGMNIEGAEWSSKTHELGLNEEISNTLPSLLFKWIKVEKIKQLELSNK